MQADHSCCSTHRDEVTSFSECIRQATDSVVSATGMVGVRTRGGTFTTARRGIMGPDGRTPIGALKDGACRANLSNPGSPSPTHAPGYSRRGSHGIRRKLPTMSEWRELSSFSMGYLEQPALLCHYGSSGACGGRVYTDSSRMASRIHDYRSLGHSHFGEFGARRRQQNVIVVSGTPNHVGRVYGASSPVRGGRV